MSLEVFRIRNRRKSGDENSGFSPRIPSLTFDSPPRPSSRSSTPSTPPSAEHAFFSLDARVSSTIAEVLNRPSGFEAPRAVDASTLAALATKAHGLQSDNKRLRSEMRALAADRAEMAVEIERLRSAMRDIVRVAEIIAIPNCACRSAPSSAPTSPASESFSSN